MRKNHIFAITFFTLLFSACSSDEPVIPDKKPEEPDDSKVEYNRWIYSAMNKEYLWRDDLPDSLDCDYNLPPEDFFKSILSEKDRFSYMTNNPYYDPMGSQQLGFAWQRCRDKAGNEALAVIYVTSENAKKAGLQRGDFVRLESSAGKISLSRIGCRDSRFHDTGDMIEFTLDDVLKKNTVLLDSVYNIDGHRIGYICYLEYKDKSDLYKPLEKMATNDITDLILDLRYNPGGLVNTCRFLCNCIIPASGYGKIFQQCSYNSLIAAENLKDTGSEFTFNYYANPLELSGITLADADIIPLAMPKLYVITSSHTASASEANVVCLRPFMEVTIIGERTVGKGVGSWTVYDKRFPRALQPITMRYYNAEGHTTPETGLEPDIPMQDSYLTRKGDIGKLYEPLLVRTLQEIGVEFTPQPIPLGVRQADVSGITPVGEPSYVMDFRRNEAIETLGFSLFNL